MPPRGSSSVARALPAIRPGTYSALLPSASGPSRGTFVASSSRHSPFDRRCFASSSGTTAPSANETPRPPRQPSPYRLLQPHTFLAKFAPLHVKGWRVDSLVSRERLIVPSEELDAAILSHGTKSHETDTPEEQAGESGDLQDRRLIRAFDLGEGKEGWRALLRFVQKVGEAVEEEDHHPSIHISPFSDYRPPLPTLIDRLNPGYRYIVELSTHTHTPLPPAKGVEMDVRPGITGKDINLAQKVEEAWEGVMGGKEKIEMKEE